jgi:hypothetical protein
LTEEAIEGGREVMGAVVDRNYQRDEGSHRMSREKESEPMMLGFPVLPSVTISLCEGRSLDFQDNRYDTCYLIAPIYLWSGTYSFASSLGRWLNWNRDGMARES